jgi:hypothetical protein
MEWQIITSAIRTLTVRAEKILHRTWVPNLLFGRIIEERSVRRVVWDLGKGTMEMIRSKTTERSKVRKDLELS